MCHVRCARGLAGVLQNKTVELTIDGLHAEGGAEGAGDAHFTFFTGGGLEWIALCGL